MAAFRFDDLFQSPRSLAGAFFYEHDGHVLARSKVASDDVDVLSSRTAEFQSFEIGCSLREFTLGCRLGRYSCLGFVP